jgi:TRAP-type C4-dicarboxylate transport system permease small subunit
LDKLEKTKFWLIIQKVLRFGLIVCGVAVVLITFAATLTRAISVDFRGYEEFLVAFAIWLYMFGAAYGSFEKSHITADILSIVIKEGLFKDILALVRNFLIVVLGIVFFHLGIRISTMDNNNGNKNTYLEDPYDRFSISHAFWVGRCELL